MRVSLNKIIQYIFSAFLLLGCESVYYQINPNFILISTLISAILLIFTISNGHIIRISKKSILWLGFYLLMVVTADFFVENTSLFYFGRFYIAVPIFMFLCLRLDSCQKWELLSVVESIIFFLAISSLLLWVLGPIMGVIKPTMGYYFEWGMNKHYEGFWGLLFTEKVQYKIILGTRIIRNISIYPEGPFSSLVFLMGFVIYLLSERNKTSLFKIVIYILAIFSSLSTTGWCLCLIIVGVWRLKKFDKNYKSVAQRIFNRDLIIASLFAIVIYMFYTFISMKAIEDTENYLAHVMAFVYGFDLFKDNLIYGVGIGQSAKYGNTTSGFFKVMGDGGIVLSLIYLVPVIAIIFKTRIGKSNFKIFALTVFSFALVVLVIYQYTLFYLFFVALEYSELLGMRVESTDEQALVS